MAFRPELKDIIPNNENVRYVYYNKIVGGLKDTSRCHYVKFATVSRPASHPVKTALPNCQDVLLAAFLSRSYNILNEDVSVTLCLEEEYSS